MKKVHLVQAGAVEDDDERVVLPECVQLSLLEIGGAAKEGISSVLHGMRYRAGNLVNDQSGVSPVGDSANLEVIRYQCEERV